jgi:hypothetical protein
MPLRHIPVTDKEVIGAFIFSQEIETYSEQNNHIRNENAEIYRVHA